MSVFLQLLKETGVDSGEAWKLRWIDVDNQSARAMVMCRWLFSLHGFVFHLCHFMRWHALLAANLALLQLFYYVHVGSHPPVNFNLQNVVNWVKSRFENMRNSAHYVFYPAGAFGRHVVLYVQFNDLVFALQLGNP